MFMIERFWAGPIVSPADEGGLRMIRDVSVLSVLWYHGVKGVFVDM